MKLSSAVAHGARVALAGASLGDRDSHDGGGPVDGGSGAEQ